jgi:hypothetical protein
MTKQSIPHRMHEQMHRLPGVPEHREAETLNQRSGAANRPLKNRPLQNHHARINQNRREPKVLVGWQNAIGRFFSRQER